MRVERNKNGKIYLWMDRAEFSALEEVMQPTERLTLDSLTRNGLFSYILDFPTNNFIAVLEIGDSAAPQAKGDG